MRGLFYIFILFIICCHPYDLHPQDQKIADSLAGIYIQDKLQGIEKLVLLRDLSFYEKRDLNLSLKYANELITLATRDHNDSLLNSGYFRKGNSLLRMGDIQEAIQAFFMSTELAVKRSDIIMQGLSYSSIADCYTVTSDFENSEINYNKAIHLLRKTEDSVSLASALNNAGDSYFEHKNYDSALNYFQESGSIYKNMNFIIGIAYSKGNIGMVHAEQGKDSLALSYIISAINILEDLEDYYPISVYLTYMSDIYAEKQNWDQAFAYAERSLDLANKYGLKTQISEAYLQLSELYEKREKQSPSLKNYKQYILYRDSVTNIQTVQEMAGFRTDYEVSQKQIEVDLLNEKQRNQQITVIATIIALVLIMVLAAGLFRRNRYIQKSRELIEIEKNRSDSLLLNILPQETAQELKDYGKVKAKKFDSVSVLFTDFEGFTRYSANLSPEELVKSVDFYYSKFDEIIEKYGLEKIKTVGDSYMAAGGLPFPSKDHAYQMTQAALEIANFVKESKKNDPDDQTRFDIRIGINTGPVVAGVVGTKKFAYDIWGDTVNIASRMESNSIPGRVNISESTYELIKNSFECEYRGEFQAKNKGLMKMYFVNNLLT